MPTAVERITPTKSFLVGSVVFGPFGQPLSQMNLPQVRTGGSLKLVHSLWPVSPQIRSAMLNKTILPTVEINTPTGMVTLVNAKIVNIKPYVPLPKPERIFPPSGFLPGQMAAARSPDPAVREVALPTTRPEWRR